MPRTNKTLDEQYFVWLYGQVASIRNRNPVRSYWELLRSLYSHKFIWNVPNDDNRVADGLDLREKWLEESGAERDRNWLELECSMLEMLIALSHHLGFQTSEEPMEWFWRMLDNLELRQYNDNVFNSRIPEIIDDTVDMINERTYNPNGYGGLFPLQRPDRDQTKVEIWYQMAAYLQEHGY